MSIDPVTRHTIEGLLYRYADAADRLDAAEVARVLGDADVTFGGDRAQGEDEVTQLFHEQFRSAPLARHLVTNVTIDSHDADQALSVWATYLRVSRASPPELLSVGQYVAAVTDTDRRGPRFLAFEVRTEGFGAAPPSQL